MVTDNKQSQYQHGTPNSSCVVLIVDDSEVDRYTYRHYLESSSDFSYNIVDCESAETALQLCIQHCPDLILIDYLLPDTNGLEFFHELTKKLETLPPVIMLTGQGSEAVAVAAMKYGAMDYLLKGQLTAQKLMNSVANALTERQLQVKLEKQRQQRDLLNSITLKISHSFELAQILHDGVEGTRELLGCCRTLIHRFDRVGSGMVVVESVLPEWPSVLGERIQNEGLQNEQSSQITEYARGHKLVVSDVEAANFTAVRKQLLHRFQVKSVLVVPILIQDISADSTPSLWGLLVAHHCQSVHEWQPDELNLLDELSVQMSIAIQQAELVSELQTTIKKQQAIEQQLRSQVIEIEQTNSRLSQTGDLLEKRNQELDEFSRIASHDLQAPLRGIANLAQWLVQDLDGQLPTENQHQLKLIQSRVLQMDTLINGLLEYARVGKENINTISVNISELLAAVVDMLAPPPNFQIKFSANLPTIETQILLLKQVLSNLIGNAIKYHDRANGQVEILVEDAGLFLKFTILDDGPGIALEHHSKIFGVFQTLAGQNDQKGTGIGLAIVKKIVESQGGEVWVKSAMGEGSAFSFTWRKAA
jgi:signal transduction histidine kinase/CheY-like chemotaxis protein